MPEDGNQERRQRRAEVLADLLESEGWQNIVIPVLVARQKELERRVMTAATIEDLRQYQGGHRVLAEMLQRPTEFFAEKERPA